MHKLFLTVVLATSSFSAMGKANPLMSISSSAPTQDSIFKQVFHVEEGEYDLYIISTCITGIGEVSMGNFTLGGYDDNFAMLEQEFIFTKDDRTLKQCFSPARRIKATTANGHTYTFLETAINRIDVILNEDEIYYDLRGMQMQDMAPMMGLIYNIKGDLLFHHYRADIKIVEKDGLKELSAGYVIDLPEDSDTYYKELTGYFKQYDRLPIHTKRYFNGMLMTNFYPPYNEAYKD